MSTNKNDANKAAVLAALDGLRAALTTAPENAAVTRVLDQCGRLELAIAQFHAEGLRFAAFTLLRMVQSGGTAFPDAVHSATRTLKTALDAAGYPH
jgi:hypothetical protein